MKITVHIIPTEGMHHSHGFKRELHIGLNNLERVINQHCLTSKSYAIGGGSILDTDGNVLMNYEINT